MKKYIYLLGLFSAFLLGFGSCTDFFSTSLASWAARDPKTLVPPVTADNVDELIQKAENNPDLSLEVLKGIEDAVKGAKPADAAALQAASLEAAANATGLGVSLFNQIGNASAATSGDNSTAVDFILDTIDGMRNLDETAKALEKILPEPGTKEWDKFAAAASPDDLATAAVIILAAEAKKAADSGKYLSEFDPYADDAEDPSTQENLALALALAAASGEMDGSFNDFLQELKLLDASKKGSDTDGDNEGGDDEGEGGGP